MQAEQEIVDAGAQIIWVLEENSSGQIGTATDCRRFMDGKDSAEGWCVGDGQTRPTPAAFDDSPLGPSRGFDMIVDRRSMQVVFTSTHGSGASDMNLNGSELLAEVQRIVGAG